MSIDERPTVTGRSGPVARLRRRWQPRPWHPQAIAITVVTSLLLLVGLVMSLSASFVDAAEAGDPFGIFRRQVVWAVIGLVAFAGAANLDPRVWRRLAWPLLLVAIAGLVLVLVPGVGETRYGSTRWIGIGPMFIQPSEIAKLAALLWLADVLERKRPRDGSLHETSHLLIPALPLLGVLAAFVLAQPDLGTTILLALVIGAVLWVEGLPGRYVAATAGAGVLAVAALAVVAPYRVARIRGWLWAEDYPLDEGFQLLQSLYALGSGGLFGLGLGSSRGKWNFIPNPETDFIFAIIGEELGLVGALVVLSLFAVLLYLGLKVAYGAEHGFLRTVSLAITAWLVGQAFINVGTVIGLLPITGVTLPLVSVGGSSLVSTLVALGILVAIARRPVDEPAPQARRQLERRRGVSRSGGHA
jgi:cell division protein FtsW